MERAWKWFVQIDIFVTLAGFVALGGWHAYWLVTLSDVWLLGAMITLAFDLLALALLAAASLVLLVARRTRSHGGVLAGTLCQLAYGAGYGAFYAKMEGFLTPGFMGAPAALTVGLVGLVMCLAVPKGQRGWEKPGGGPCPRERSNDRKKRYGPRPYRFFIWFAHSMEMI